RRIGPSSLDRMEFRRSISNDDEEVLAAHERLVELRIAGVDAEDRRRREFSGCRDDDHIPDAVASQDSRADMEVTAAQQRALGPDRADHDLPLRTPIE